MKSRAARVQYMFAIFASAMVELAGPEVLAQPSRYAVVDLGVVDEDTFHVVGDSINEIDEVCGKYLQTNMPFWQPFQWKDGEFFTLCRSDAVVEVNAINESDISTGYLDDTGFDQDGIVWYGPDHCEQFDVPGDTFGYGINEANVVAFTAMIDGNDGILSKAYRWENGVATELMGFGTLMDSGAYAINNQGWVGGSADECLDCFPGRPVIWFGGQMQELVVNSPQNKGRVISLNDDGQALGYAYDDEHFLPFVWHEGNVTDLGTQGSNGSVEPETISNADEIIGNWHDDDSDTDIPVIYIDGEWVDLNTLIDPNSGWTLQFADDINAAGRIVGKGKFEGRTRGFILIPRDEFRTTGAVPGVAGEFNGVIAHGATPAGRVVFLYALSRGATTVPKVCPGITIDLARPIYVIGSRRADANGDCTIQRYVPESAGGTTIFIQAVDIESCETSPVVAHHFPNA